MCKNCQMPAVVRPHPADQEQHESLKGWEEVDRTIAAATAIMDGIKLKQRGVHTEENRF
jgi:hypothetical protein